MGSTVSWLSKNDNAQTDTANMSSPGIVRNGRDDETQTHESGAPHDDNGGNGDDDDDAWTCPVCYEDDRRAVVTLQCQHRVCFSCVRRMLETESCAAGDQCPLCQALPPDFAEAREEALARQREQARAVRKLELQLEEARGTDSATDNMLHALESRLVNTQMQLRAARRRLRIAEEHRDQASGNDGNDGRPRTGSLVAAREAFATGQGRPPRTFNSVGVNNFGSGGGTVARYQNMRTAERFRGVKPTFP